MKMNELALKKALLKLEEKNLKKLHQIGYTDSINRKIQQIKQIKQDIEMLSNSTKGEMK